MKIHMGNVGMTLHVIHKLRTQGIDNVKVNMDWQHLIMNGENLAEYAALLDAEGLLGHQHANSGLGHVRRRQHGRRDRVHGDDGAGRRAAAGRLRRDGGERLGFDLYPYTEDQVAAVRRASCSGASSTGSPAGSTRTRCVPPRPRRTPCARTNSFTRRWRAHRSDAPDRARRRHDLGQGGSRSIPTAARCSTSAQADYRF